MRKVMVGLIAPALLVSCTTRYVVDTEALAEARRSNQRSVVARTEDGGAAVLRLESIEEEWRLAGGDTGVEAWDPGPALRGAGWLALGVGAILVTAGLSRIDFDSRPATYDEAMEEAGASIAIAGAGGAAMLTGLGLLIPGYLVNGPELPASPAAQALPPAR